MEDAVPVVETQSMDPETDSKQAFLECIRLIERLHRRFLDVVKSELERLGIEDINNVQAVLLSNIENENVTIGELTLRGYYMGSNVSYNVKKLVENDYLVQERSAHDRRTTRVRLSEKGQSVVSAVNDLFEHNITALAENGLASDELRGVTTNLRVLERFWSDYVNYGPA
ncbi:MAG: MarR family transcriptional regulator [Alphaproteobacteria bacterium]